MHLISEAAHSHREGAAAGIDKDKVFTTNPRETPVHIVVWGLLGEAFPFFKPNFTKMEQYGRDMGAEEVRFMRQTLQALTASLQQALVCHIKCISSSSVQCMLACKAE